MKAKDYPYTVRTISVETSDPWLIKEIKSFLKLRQSFKYFCKTKRCKANIKSYVKYLNQKPL